MPVRGSPLLAAAGSAQQARLRRLNAMIHAQPPALRFAAPRRSVPGATPHRAPVTLCTPDQPKTHRNTRSPHNSPYRSAPRRTQDARLPQARCARDRVPGVRRCGRRPARLRHLPKRLQCRSRCLLRSSRLHLRDGHRGRATRPWVPAWRRASPRGSRRCPEGCRMLYGLGRAAHLAAQSARGGLAASTLTLLAVRSVSLRLPCLHVSDRGAAPAVRRVALAVETLPHSYTPSPLPLSGGGTS
jgi:hypothetical protein